MEPAIKSEPCEELYSEEDILVQPTGDMERIDTISQPHNSLKRLYEEMEDTSSTNRNVNQQQPINCYQTCEYPSAPQNPQTGLYTQGSNQVASEAKPLKKLKRLDANVLFNPPFFNVVEEVNSPNTDAIGARCYSCGKVVKGNRGISSNFIKHMKRSHPETYKLYGGYKSHKTKSYYLPNLPETAMKKPISIVESGPSGSDSTTANSNEDTSQFYESKTALEANGSIDSSDENDDSVIPTNKIAVPNDFAFSSKTLETLGNLINEKLKTFVKQDEFIELSEKVNALTKTNESCSVSESQTLIEFKTELHNLKKECLELRSATQKSESSKRQLRNELQTIDKILHQRRLIIRNITVCDPENPLKSVQKLFKEKMNLEDIKIIHCCIIPSAKSSLGSNKENVSIELASPQDCKAIFRQTQKLKGTGIFIESEISPFQRKRKNKLMVLRKELLRRKPDLKVLVRDTTLVVNGHNFYWDDVEGLCHDGKYDNIGLNGVQHLKNVAGLDLQEFIIFLQNYDVQI